MDLLLFEPDQPQNTGTLMRLGACLDMPVHIIEPCGFPFSPKSVKRYVMDYAEHLTLHHHLSWDNFVASDHRKTRRLVLLTTKAADNYCDFAFRPDDLLLLGSESRGVPSEVHENADARVTIPMRAEARSLNVAVAAAMVAGEALRQTRLWPDLRFKA